MMNICSKYAVLRTKCISIDAKLNEHRDSLAQACLDSLSPAWRELGLRRLRTSKEKKKDIL